MISTNIQASETAKITDSLEVCGLEGGTPQNLSARPGSGEGALPCDVPADEECLDRLCPLVGVDGLDVAHVTHDVVLQQDAVAAQHVARFPKHLAGLGGVVQLAECSDR